jgi:hypothetical protein
MGGRIFCVVGYHARQIWLLYLLVCMVVADCHCENPRFIKHYRGVLSWIAGVYTLVAQYLTVQLIHLSSLEFLLIVACGAFFVSLIIRAVPNLLDTYNTWANYDADAQRQRVRDTKGNCTVWGRPPKTLMVFV